MFATRKSDLKQFPCGSEDVCRIDEGNTNTFLSEPRAVEEFLRAIEPRYSAACSAFEAGSPTQSDVFALAGFVAYVLSCSPTAMRLGSEPLRETVKVEAKILEALGDLPPAPAELDGKQLSELLDEGAVQVQIDPKFPQALGIGAILDLTRTFGNSRWEVLLNPHEESPFFTSDFPACIEKSSDPAIALRVLPLTPTLALRIIPRLDVVNDPAFGFSLFRFRRRSLSKSEVRSVNQTIVRCAEDLVFHQINDPWVRTFVRRNAKFRVENEVTTFPTGTGYLSLTRTVVRERTTAA